MTTGLMNNRNGVGLLERSLQWHNDPKGQMRKVAEFCTRHEIKRVFVFHFAGDALGTEDRQGNEYQYLAAHEPDRLDVIREGIKDWRKSGIEHITLYTGPGLILPADRLDGAQLWPDVRVPALAAALADQYRPWAEDIGIDEICVDNTGAGGAGPAGQVAFIREMSKRVACDWSVEAIPVSDVTGWDERTHYDVTIRRRRHFYDHRLNKPLEGEDLEAVLKGTRRSVCWSQFFLTRLFDGYLTREQAQTIMNCVRRGEHSLRVAWQPFIDDFKGHETPLRQMFGGLSHSASDGSNATFFEILAAMKVEPMIPVWRDDIAELAKAGRD